MFKITKKRYCPPFKSELQSSRSEVETTCRIASARIHVDRKMEQIKNFRILQGIMPLAISDFADQIVFVCAVLINLLPPLVSELFTGTFSLNMKCWGFF